MVYTVGVDNGGRTTKAYMEAFGVRGIPHAFIVDKSGRIAWHGHPLGELESVLDKVLAGKYDIEAAKQGRKALQLAEDEALREHIRKQLALYEERTKGAF